jgi:hypothetical protein
MRRRTILKQSAGVLAASALFAGVSAGREEGEAPNDSVDTASVHPLADEPLEVRTGQWIEHSVGWVDREGEESTREDVERWFDKTRIEVFIGGEKIEDPERYWTDIQYDEEADEWGVAWRYTTPPKSPGLYTFKVNWIYEETFEDGDWKTEPGTYPTTGKYRVVPGKNGNGRGNGNGK